MTVERRVVKQPVEVVGLVYTSASVASIGKVPGTTLLGLKMPAAVDNSAARVGFEVTIGDSTYLLVATDVIGTATNYRPAFLVNQYLVLDPTIMYAIEEASNLCITFYAADGTTAASQTAVTLGLVLTAIL